MPLPDGREWALIGVSDAVELKAGHQSRVFRARVEGVELAVKLTDRRFADRAALETRMEVVESLATDLPGVVAPQRLAHSLVQPIGGWLATATSFQHGDTVDQLEPGAGELLGRTLSQLHVALARLPPRPLPPVAALGSMRPDAERSDWQLLHGDFSEQNVIATPDGLRVFDFDDCGYGPIEYDLANSLYMVLFDEEVRGTSERYRAFRPAFLAGYAAGSGTQRDGDVIDELIAMRIDALGGWLADLTTAPIGIRTSSAAWREVLQAFVRSHRGG
jgi:Ser/Thr protein kinase RdoA (MazF antagonist)